MNEAELVSYIKSEGWQISDKRVQGKTEYTIETARKKYITLGHLTHPVKIHREAYREGATPQERYYHLKKFHDFLWPENLETWNHWTERRFETHCENWRFIGHAGGAGIGKSRDAAMLATLFWFSWPEKNGVIVASTTLTSLSTRIWGYVLEFIKNMKVKMPYTYKASPNEMVVPKDLDRKRGEVETKRHSMRTMAAPIGTSEDAIRNYIGSHPENKLMLILDEAPDLEPVILKSVSNLEAGGDADGKLELNAIGNSMLPTDLHGIICTPDHKDGFAGVDKDKDYKWTTVHHRGVCLYFSPFDSPAIHEPDPEKRARLSKIFITEEKIAQARQEYGENSIDYWRMILGFWANLSTKQRVFVEEPFLKEYGTHRSSLWSGLYPLKRVAGLDPAFSAGGDKCILRIAILGHDVFGSMVLDYREENLLYDIPLNAVGEILENQIADNVIKILSDNNMSLEDVAVDCTGPGRVLPEYIRLRAKDKGIIWGSPLKISSARQAQNPAGIGGKKKPPTDVLTLTPLQIWENIRTYMNTRQICGLDAMSLFQFSNRLMTFNEKTHVRQLESKEAYKVRLNAITKGKAGSPDHADAAALALYAAITRHGFQLEQVRAIPEAPRSFLEEKLLYHAIAEKQEEAARAPLVKQQTLVRPTYSGAQPKPGYGSRGRYTS